MSNRWPGFIGKKQKGYSRTHAPHPHPHHTTPHATAGCSTGSALLRVHLQCLATPRPSLTFKRRLLFALLLAAPYVARVSAAPSRLCWPHRPYLQVLGDPAAFISASAPLQRLCRLPLAHLPTRELRPLAE